MARILLGVSGGIAAYKAVELVRLATGAGHSVRVIQTPASLNFVGRATFEGVTGPGAMLAASGLMTLHVVLLAVVTAHVLLHKRKIGAAIGWIGLPGSVLSYRPA